MLTSKEAAILAAKALDSKKAVNLMLLEVKSVTALTEYMLLATGTSDTHLRALCDEVERLEREGSACVFYPDEMPVDNKETNWEKLCASYDAGYAQAQREAASWEAWIGGR